MLIFSFKMKSKRKFGLFLYLIFLQCVTMVTSSAWLQDPPSRSAAWYYQIKAPVNYNFRNLDCGGVPVKINSDGSRNCGLCGDPVSDPQPRPNENGGKYARQIIRTRYFESGQEAEISIWNNLPGSPGFYEFRLCDDGLSPSQSCLDRNLLFITESNSTSMPVPQTQGLTMVHVRLPVGVTCEYCLLQWRFRKDNSVSGCDTNTKWCGIGRGPQIEYYNCADITIGGQGQPKPNYIQDPVYTAADYGSAYDVSTTLTTSGGGIRTPPPSGGLDGSSPSATTQIPIFTIPTLPPTNTHTPGTTSGSTGTSGGPTTERLVVDANGNPVGTTLNAGSSSSNSNRQLLLLLGLLPLIGAAALRNNNNPGTGVFPGQTGGFYYGNPPLSAYYLGTSPGFGNFGPGGFPVAAGGVVGAPVGLTPGFGAPVVGGFQPNFFVAPPGRFGRSVTETPQQSTTFISDSRTTFQFDPSLDGSGQLVNNRPVSFEMNELQDLVFRNGELIDGVLPDRITHVQPRSVKEDGGDIDIADTDHRGKRQIGSEYGQVGTSYGSSNQGMSPVNLNSAQQINNVRSVSQPAPNSFGGLEQRRNGLAGNSGHTLMVNRRLRNGRKRLSGSGEHPNIANPKRNFLPEKLKNSAMSDINGLANTFSRRTGFQASGNPLARKLFRNKIPSAHDWYLRLMSKPVITRTEVQ